MLLALLGALLVVGVLVWLSVVSLRTWRSVKAFGRDVSSAGDRVALAQAELEAVMAIQADQQAIRQAARDERSEW